MECLEFLMMWKPAKIIHRMLHCLRYLVEIVNSVREQGSNGKDKGWGKGSVKGRKKGSVKGGKKG